MKPIDLLEHQEGGRFREVYRSVKKVINYDGATKSALTHIYFSLNQGEVSRYHKVASDEIWNLYKGAGIHLYTWDGTGSLPNRITLSADNNCFCHVVPAGLWQAAKPISDTVLMGCSVGPGFEYSDFTLIDPNSEEAKKIVSASPDMAKFINL